MLSKIKKSICSQQKNIEHEEGKLKITLKCAFLTEKKRLKKHLDFEKIKYKKILGARIEW